MNDSRVPALDLFPADRAHLYPVVGALLVVVLEVHAEVVLGTERLAANLAGEGLVAVDVLDQSAK